MSIKQASFTRSVQLWADHCDREASLPGRCTTKADFGILCLVWFYARLNRNM